MDSSSSFIEFSKLPAIPSFGLVELSLVSPGRLELSRPFVAVSLVCCCCPVCRPCFACFAVVSASLFVVVGYFLLLPMMLLMLLSVSYRQDEQEGRAKGQQEEDVSGVLGMK